MQQKRIISDAQRDEVSNWRDGKAVEYGKGFNAEVPSDIVAYEALLYIMSEVANKKGKPINVIDYGCNIGNFTREIASADMSDSVIGLDISAEVIDSARTLSRESGNVNYRLMEDPSKLAQCYPELENSSDVVVMTFVDPVIPTSEDLKVALKNAAFLLEEGGSIFLLRLNEQSFSVMPDYLFYSEKNFLDPVNMPGARFVHKLRNKDNAEIELTDHNYPYSLMRALLEEVGLRNVRLWNLSENMENGLGKKIQRTIQDVQANYAINFQDEFGGRSGTPMYQIIQAINFKGRMLNEA